MSHNDTILTLIAVEVGKSKYGVFTTSMARAWTVADPENKDLIREAWSNIIDRYELRARYDKEIEKHLPEYLNEGGSATNGGL